MESERNEEHIKAFELNRQISEERFAAGQKILTELGNGLKAFLQFGENIERITKQNLQSDYDRIQTEIAKMENEKQEYLNVKDKFSLFLADILDGIIKSNYKLKDRKIIWAKVRRYYVPRS